LSEIQSPNARDRYGYALCGLGPAGCGFLLHAIREGAIGQLAENGLVLIDRSSKPGPGKVGHYRLTGNSLSRAFLDCVDDPKLTWLFEGLEPSAPSITELREIEFLAPPLDVIGDFLTAMAQRTMAYLAHEYDIPILLETSVDTIQRRADGSYTLHLQDAGTGQKSSLDVDNVLCSFGGRQGMDVVENCEVQPGLRLGDHAQRLMISDDFLMMSNEEIQRAIPMKGSDEVVIVGGSHSAMSTIDRLTDGLGPVGLRRIVMLHREPLRLYYASVEEAERDAYPFDRALDLCPMSGRVNRFGGLRYRSFDVARSILDTGKTPDQSVEVVSVPLYEADADVVSRYLERAPAVITCLGYQANLPPLVDHWNREIALQNTPRGLEIDDDGRALLADGEPLAGLFVYGIGSRLLKRSDAIGGELSFQGSADGVWIYQNHGGGVILNALQKTPAYGSDRADHSSWRERHVRVASQR
jgi:hypothetical protein